ncbi:class I SAM-dependent methyltransferase [Prochlorococcus sp. AH-716-P08]|nr:class I SAM-dependent methyltransferase [Prochlorococcus sp. AH-716-P08]
MQDQENINYSGLNELLTLEYMKNYNQSIVIDAIRCHLNAKRIVDFGAGIGTLSKIFRNKYNKDPICIEIDEININYLKKRNFTFLNNIENLKESVDLVFSSNVLEHIEDDYAILTLIRKKLKNNGKIFLYLPAKMILWSKLDEVVGHYRRYEISKLRKLLQKAGFKIIKINYSDSLGFFFTLIWRFLNKVNKNPLPSKRSLIFYDRFIFPLSRIIDSFGFKYLIGKNIVLVAKKNI